MNTARKEKSLRANTLRGELQPQDLARLEAFDAWKDTMTLTDEQCLCDLCCAEGHCGCETCAEPCDCEDEENLTAQPDTIPGNLDRLLELAEQLEREGHALAMELHATYIDLREGFQGLTV